MPAQQADQQRANDNIEDDVSRRDPTLREQRRHRDLESIGRNRHHPRQPVLGRLQAFPDIGHTHGVSPTYWIQDSAAGRLRKASSAGVSPAFDGLPRVGPARCRRYLPDLGN